ncbi:hypothetical protein C2S52_007879 [Perilla frutescens var. hirtella]|nr:hypothetical protein C2S52_007879 [Perilla frutescens var. hirtella]
MVCRRWRYLWTLIPNLKLDFNAAESFNILKYSETLGREWFLLLNRERSSYKRWVNDVIALCKEKGSTIEEFKVCFDLDNSDQSCIDEWVAYALSRQVWTLDLRFTDFTYSRIFGRFAPRYSFPFKLVNELLMSVKKLRRICMKNVDVDGEALEYFLQNCPLLEDLFVSRSNDLMGLKIIGPLPSFKRLEVCSCQRLLSLEICDLDLVYLKYTGMRMINFRVQNLPRLVSMHIGGTETLSMKSILSVFSSYLPQLEAFTFDRPFSMLDTKMFYENVKMINLKHLMVADDAGYILKTHLHLADFLRASPCLETFVVKASRSCHIPESWFDHDVSSSDLYRYEIYSYPHLKKVTFLAYRNVEIDVELIQHLVKYAAALEEIVVDVRHTTSWDPTFYTMLKYDKHIDRVKYIEVEMNARARAKRELPRIVPSRINLKILD